MLPILVNINEKDAISLGFDHLLVCLPVCKCKSSSRLGFVKKGFEAALRSWIYGL